MTKEDTSKLSLAETSFKVVLDADIHEDTKAGRILAAMAFLTAAAAALFANSHVPSIPQSFKDNLAQEIAPFVSPASAFFIVDRIVRDTQPIRVEILGLDWATATFSLYMFLVLSGALLFLGAMGPSLNLPKRPVENRARIKSLLFFQTIPEVSREHWQQHWESKLKSGLDEEMAMNFADEAYLIAEKTRTKVNLMSWGSLLFKGAFVPLTALVIGLYPLDALFIYLYASVAVAIFFLVEAIEVYTKLGLDRITKYGGITILVLAAGLMVSWPRLTASLTYVWAGLLLLAAVSLVLRPLFSALNPRTV